MPNFHIYSSDCESIYEITKDGYFNEAADQQACKKTVLMEPVEKSDEILVKTAGGNFFLEVIDVSPIVITKIITDISRERYNRVIAALKNKILEIKESASDFEWKTHNKLEQIEDALTDIESSIEEQK